MGRQSAAAIKATEEMKAQEAAKAAAARVMAILAEALSLKAGLGDERLAEFIGTRVGAELPPEFIENAITAANAGREKPLAHATVRSIRLGLSLGPRIADAFAVGEEIAADKSRRATATNVGLWIADLMAQGVPLDNARTKAIGNFKPKAADMLQKKEFGNYVAKLQELVAKMTWLGDDDVGAANEAVATLASISEGFGE